ncbi:GntR family transcriptional regulator [Actinomadura pelletieri DSM 43383]|uniref:GntR family transcriptional regulator n=1 Tax=Actinomadura pelletieri DSM 43383 TaxID=1120940 RepID=A0A495QXB4_9ACTN|nr:GntR family transcriptional regulator [Actinomadura pelletieri]RKS78772.1 GntR family transcriptional regulator [Actinomadura pelletieri DSM 43383]
MPVKRRSSTPSEPKDGRSLPHALRDELERMIRETGLQPGDRLPSENELIARHKVGRTTVREAFRLLEQEGLVQSQQGLGRFVRTRPALQRPLTRLEGVTDMLASRGFEVTNSVLSVTLDEPSPTERAALRLPANRSVIRLERLRRHEDDAVVYSVDVFERAIFEQPISEIDWTGSLFTLFEQAGHRVSAAIATVSAVHLDASLTERLGMPSDIAWLLLSQEHTDDEGRPILLSQDYHRGTDFSFQVQRQRQD